MLIAFRDRTVQTAADARAVSGLGGATAEDVAAAMTALAYVPSLGDLLGMRSLALTRLTRASMSDYFLGTRTAGVTCRPVDDLGRAIRTSHTKESLMTVTAVTIQAIGHSREEALSA